MEKLEVIFVHDNDAPVHLMVYSYGIDEHIVSHVGGPLLAGDRHNHLVDAAGHERIELDAGRLDLGGLRGVLALRHANAEQSGLRCLRLGGERGAGEKKRESGGENVVHVSSPLR